MKSKYIIVLILISLIILIIHVTNKYKDYKNTRKFKAITILVNIVKIIVIVVLILIIKDKFTSIKEQKNNENEKLQSFEITEKEIEKESKYYEEVMSREYENQKCNSPYIPDGFSYVTGEYHNGYVIQDKNQNQYVWIPCTNKDIGNITKLQRKNFVINAFIEYNDCNNVRYEEFLNSALEHGGFYISRFEIGNENKIPVSKKDIEVWRNVTKEQAENIIKKMYNSQEINCELINGYAYDTTLEWIKSTNKINGDFYELDTGLDFELSEKLYTGRKAYNNIYDFCDNILEITSEESYGTVIIRGFSNSKNVQYLENLFSNHSRYSILKNEFTFGYVDTLGFRTVLYK